MRLTAFLLLIITCLPSGTSAAEGTVDQVALYVPAFDGPQPLARNVATVLNLQTWRTLRKAPTPNPHKRNFGKGLIWWGDQPLQQASQEEAEQAARNLGAQMTLWGYAQPYGDGVVVQAYLALPHYEDSRKLQLEFWRLTLSGTEIVADLPRREFEFTPIVLRNQLVQRYSLPSAIQLCSDKHEPCSGGPLGNGFTAFEHQGSWSHIRTNDGHKGWINLPGLSESPNEVVDLTGALISIYRGDWEQADRFLTRVIATPDIRTSIRADALLLLAMVTERFNKSGQEFIERALDINPYSRTAVQYKVMADISAVNRSTGPLSTHRLLETAKFLRERRHLFLEGDPWLNAVTHSFQSLGLPGY